MFFEVRDYYGKVADQKAREFELGSSYLHGFEGLIHSL